MDASGGVSPNLQQLKAKYVGSSRGVLEQLFLQYNIARVELWYIYIYCNVKSYINPDDIVICLF